MKTRHKAAVVSFAICAAFYLGANAQVKTETQTTHGQATHEVSVERAEVVHVSGNDVVVKMEDGTIRHVSNVPESARVMVDGKELGVHDLKPGMKLQRTITTSSTPKLITTTQTVTGTVWSVNAPKSVILTLEDGKNQQFKIPSGQLFMVDGKTVDAFHLKKGMRVSATKVVEEPATDLNVQKQLTGTMPPPPPPDQPILVEAAAPVEAPPAEAPAEPAALPKTGSLVPLIGMIGMFSVLSSLSLTVLRKIRK